MFEIIQAGLSSPFGSFAFVLGIMGAVFVGIWKVSYFAAKLKGVDKLEQSIDIIKTDIQYLKGFVQLFKESNNPLSQRQSPVSMTDIGKTVATELNIQNMVINHWDAFCVEVAGCLKKDCNPYDIQVESFKVGDKYQDFINPQELLAIKNHAFNAGYNLGIYNILFGLIIRDKILQDKGFKQSDIDLHDPTIKTT